ncbi:hypothetical protein EMIT0P265_40540 [Pseudomonas zeae]
MCLKFGFSLCSFPLILNSTQIPMWERWYVQRAPAVPRRIDFLIL